MPVLTIFPFVEADDELIEEETNEVPMAREYAWDFKHKDFKRKNGKMYLVEGDEAIKIWLWKLLNTERYKELIYSWDYGHEMDRMIGKGYTVAYTKAEITRYIEEAIEYNLGDYIVGLPSIELTFEGSKLTIDLHVITIYGEVEYIG